MHLLERLVLTLIEFNWQEALLHRLLVAICQLSLCQAERNNCKGCTTSYTSACFAMHVTAPNLLCNLELGCTLCATHVKGDLKREKPTLYQVYCIQLVLYRTRFSDRLLNVEDLEKKRQRSAWRTLGSEMQNRKAFDDSKNKIQASIVATNTGCSHMCCPICPALTD